MIDTLLAPSLPNYYVERLEYSRELKTRLLKNSSDVGALVVTAIDGNFSSKSITILAICSGKG